MVASSTAGWEMADVAWGRPRGGFVRDFFVLEGVDAMAPFCRALVNYTRALHHKRDIPRGRGVGQAAAKDLLRAFRALQNAPT